MSASARAEANAAQRAAADPAGSAFVAASAGSGKTKLLTDRLLRLMLGSADAPGCPPGRIQCLTFTKAAAAEMALRLQRTLGEWVTLDDAALDRRLADLAVQATEETRRRARALFAEVLDLAGGMRIGTIHAFCQSLLRRFPLEARLSPHFRLIDEIDAAVALVEAREAMLAGAYTDAPRAALATLAGLVTADQFGALVARLQRDADRFAAARAGGEAALLAAQRRVLAAAESDAAVLAAAVRWPGEAALRAAAVEVAAQGSPTVKTRATEMLDWLGIDGTQRGEHWAVWRDFFLNADGAPRGPTRLVNERLGQARPELLATLCAEQDRVAAVEDDRRAVRAADASAALIRLAAPVLDAYDTRKKAAALLDYGDLIGRSARLLQDAGVGWVLYKLDGGLDHLLLDEVQDTAPAQWDIAGRLTGDFFAGTGVSETRRTVFAVGDTKQSIYSFQGADPREFARWRDILRGRVGAAGQGWRDVPLRVSFRSTAPVLALVDAVFRSNPAAEGVTAPGTLSHVADRADHAGSVELWPLTPAPVAPSAEAWTVPDRNLAAASSMQRLATHLADWIKGQTGGDVALPSKGRPLGPGDVLVLLRRRNAFATALVRALKARGVAVAGLDRMVLTEQPAVADLLALCDALLLPDDDLALATVLTSPLGGLDDADLIALAPQRDGPLWQALRERAGERPAWQAAHDLIATLLRRVDFATPYALLAEALGPLGGRARLYARLGPEAAEPVDELVHAALTYEAMHPASLQGFVHWLRQSGAEVKREPEAGAHAGGGAVRIMTVHGAKGLQAPLVILPDTTALPPDDGALVWAPDGAGPAVPVWAPRKELRCAAYDRARAAAARARAEEHNRLLYVALTRAEDRLVVCGWENAPGRALPPTCWYQLVQAGFTGLDGAADLPFAAWDGSVRRLASPQRAAPETSPAGPATAATAPLPRWAGAAPDWRPTPPRAEPALPERLAPSRPEGVEHGTVPPAASPLIDRPLADRPLTDHPLTGRDAAGARFRRGRLVHALLQHLPALPPAERAAALDRHLAGRGLDLDAADAAALAREVLAVLADPALAPLFGPEGRAEVPLTGVVTGADGSRHVVGGLVDRLAVLADRVLVADYKTNRTPPARAEDVPVLYLRQMAAYRAVLAAALPGRTVDCLLVWTAGPTVMPLPAALLDRHAPGARRTA